AARRPRARSDDFTRVYPEVAAPNGVRHECVTRAWAPLIRELVQLWDGRQPGLTQARKREALEHVLGAFAASPDGLYARLRGLTRAWHEAALTPARAVALVAGNGAAQDMDQPATL